MLTSAGGGASLFFCSSTSSRLSSDLPEEQIRWRASAARPDSCRRSEGSHCPPGRRRGQRGGRSCASGDGRKWMEMREECGMAAGETVESENTGSVQPDPPQHPVAMVTQTLWRALSQLPAGTHWCSPASGQDVYLTSQWAELGQERVARGNNVSSPVHSRIPAAKQPCCKRRCVKSATNPLPAPFLPAAAADGGPRRRRRRR